MTENKRRNHRERIKLDLARSLEAWAARNLATHRKDAAAAIAGQGHDIAHSMLDDLLRHYTVADRRRR